MNDNYQMLLDLLKGDQGDAPMPNQAALKGMGLAQPPIYQSNPINAATVKGLMPPNQDWSQYFQSWAK